MKSHPYFDNVDWNSLSSKPIDEITNFVASQIENQQLEVQSKLFIYLRATIIERESFIFWSSQQENVFW